MTRKLSELAEAEERREAVRMAASGFLAGEWSLEQLREHLTRDGSADAPALWAGMRKLDWDQVGGFAQAEADDDVLGVDGFCALVEETGRALAPTPLVPCVVARSLLRAAGAETGASLPVLAHTEAERTSDPFRTSVGAVETATGHRLDGVKRFVPYGGETDQLVVNARSRDGTAALFIVDPGAPGVRRRALSLLDASPCAEVRLEGVEVPENARVASGDDAARLLADAVALETLSRCAELVGVASRALELAVEYARERIAFDRPIGSFQAVQHRLVNLRGHVEVARALVRGASGLGAEHADERDVAIAMAAFAALDDLRKVPEGALQVFGGIGTTWDHDIHFFLRRAATLCALLGERARFREVVARHLAPGA